MPEFHYRLATLLDQKDAHQQECEKRLAECRADVRRAEAGLVDLMRRQEEHEDAAGRLRTAPLAGETDGEAWQARATDIAIRQQRVEDAKDEVFSQRLRIEDLRQRVTEAAAACQQAAQEAETLRKHREKSERQFRAGLDRKEALEQEEIAAAMFENRRRT